MSRQFSRVALSVYLALLIASDVYAQAPLLQLAANAPVEEMIVVGQKEVPITVAPRGLAVSLGQEHFDSINATNVEGLMKYSHESGLFNGSILVAKNGKVIYSDAFGLANEKDGRRLTTKSQFYLASVSKQFTSMAIMILKEINWQ